MAHNMMAENVTSAQVRRHRTERPICDSATQTLYTRGLEWQPVAATYGRALGYVLYGLAWLIYSSSSPMPTHPAGSH